MAKAVNATLQPLREMPACKGRVYLIFRISRLCLDHLSYIDLRVAGVAFYTPPPSPQPPLPPTSPTSTSGWQVCPPTTTPTPPTHVVLSGCVNIPLNRHCATSMDFSGTPFPPLLATPSVWLLENLISFLRSFDPTDEDVLLDYPHLVRNGWGMQSTPAARIFVSICERLAIESHLTEDQHGSFLDLLHLASHYGARIFI